jgi:hypothetical protein
MRIWDWQIRSMPDLAERIPSGDRRRLAATRAVSSMLRGVGELPFIGDSSVGRIATRARPTVDRQLSVQVPPGHLLGRPPLPGGATLDRIVLVMSHDSDEITVVPVQATEVAQRATQSFLFELTDVLEHYRRYRFAFPGRSNGFLDTLEARYGRAATDALGGIPAIAVSHPYPLDIGRLYDAIAPALV